MCVGMCVGMCVCVSNSSWIVTANHSDLTKFTTVFVKIIIFYATILGMR